MAKLSGPAMSLDASGTFAGTLVFSKWKGRPYARLRVTPANPKSAAQTGMRAAMRWISQQWAQLTTTQQNTWTTKASSNNYSPFNAFTSTNQSNVANGNWPQRQDPPEASNPAQDTIINSATANGQFIDVAWTDATIGDIFGTAIFRSTVSGFTPSRTNLVRIVDPGTTTYTDGPLASGTYYYKILQFDFAGVAGNDSGEVSATV